MTIQDAIRSGKKFKRPCHVAWIFPDTYGTLSILHQGRDTSQARWCAAMDILADDWELETVKIELSAEDIRAAWGKLYGISGLWFLDNLLKDLGLE